MGKLADIFRETAQTGRRHKPEPPESSPYGIPGLYPDDLDFIQTEYRARRTARLAPKTTEKKPDAKKKPLKRDELMAKIKKLQTEIKGLK